MANSIPPLDLASIPPPSFPVEDTPVKVKSHSTRVTKTKAKAGSSSKSPLTFSAPESCSKDCSNCGKTDCTYIFQGIYPYSPLSKSSPEKPTPSKTLKQFTIAKTSPRNPELSFTPLKEIKWMPQ